MKTLITSIATATCILLSVNARCQTASLNASVLSASSATFKITSLEMKQSDQGFNVTWEAQNQFQVAQYELQLSSDNSNFSTVKRRISAAAVNGKYEAQLKNTIIFANPVYYRLKMISLDGQESYTDSYRTTVENK